MSPLVRRHAREIAVGAVYVLLLVVLAVATPGFFAQEFAGVWVRSAPVLILAVGMTFIIIARQIDISIGSQFSWCGVIAGLAAKSGVPLPVVVVLTIVCGALMGAVNGSLVAYAGLPSIVVTLATMVILRESLRWLRQGEAVRDLPSGLQWFGLDQTLGQCCLVLIALSILLAFAWAARNLHAGRAVYAVGSDSAAARLAGIEPRHVTFWVFVLMGALIGVASVLNVVRFPQVDVNAGVGLELAVIAAVVVGGTAIAGGRGTLSGTFIGVLLLLTVGPALTFLQLPAQWERAVQGAIILAAVASDRILGRRRP